MERPEDAKGAVVIRKRFGEVAAATYFPDLLSRQYHTRHNHSNPVEYVG